MTTEDFTEGAPEDVRSRLALALDVDDIVEAQRLARVLQPWFGVAKVGLELFSAAGPEVIETMIDDGFAVFADLKLLDIPTTIRKAARVMGSLVTLLGGRACASERQPPWKGRPLRTPRPLAFPSGGGPSAAHP
jgi:hypothetical protein